ncbi:MAG TPA: NAD(P)H-binding protein [Pseudonocardiaceae bacterium]|nr:NAD(P)H-binding protein [Pseudonocardiaceae bacterium]
MTARIVLFGATGYTGRRTAREMVGRGLRPVLAGRDAARLASLADELGGLPTATADVRDATSVRALIGAGDVLVSTVGPFRQLGEAALSAAVQAGAIYLDSTGEAPFIRRVFEEFGPRAARTGASLLTAFGNDYVPGNLAGALALRAAGDSVHRVETAYYISGVGRAQVFSRGTFRSLLEVAGEPAYTWRDGIRTEPTGARMRTFPVAGRDRPALTIGSTEQYALPRLNPQLHEVDVYLGWFGPVTRALHLSSRVTPVLRRLPGSGTLLRRIGELIAGRVAEEPDAGALARLTSHFLGAAYDEGGTLVAEARLVATDPYQLTAGLLAWGAGRAAEHGVSGPGALGPVDAFGIEVLSAGAAEIGLCPP